MIKIKAISLCRINQGLVIVFERGGIKCKEIIPWFKSPGKIATNFLTAKDFSEEVFYQIYKAAREADRDIACVQRGDKDIKPLYYEDYPEWGDLLPQIVSLKGYYFLEEISDKKTWESLKNG